MQCSGVEAQLVAAQIKLESAVREKNEGKDCRIVIGYVFMSKQNKAFSKVPVYIFSSFMWFWNCKLQNQYVGIVNSKISMSKH